MRLSVVSVAALALALTACGKGPEAIEAAPGAEPEAAATAEPAPAETTAAGEAATGPADYSVLPEDETARRQALLDYATMEDSFLNDAKAQWAATAKASSAYGKAGMNEGDDPMAMNAPGQVTGALDGNTWSSETTDVGFDWIEVGFNRPVYAEALRIVFTDGQIAEAISKIELIDDTGTAHTIFSGVSPFKKDARGPRTWVVPEFEKTTFKVTGAKVTFANALLERYKEVDAIQISGE